MSAYLTKADVAESLERVPDDAVICPHCKTTMDLMEGDDGSVYTCRNELCLNEEEIKADVVMADITKRALADWLDTDVIAETIFDALEEEEISPTHENAKKVWLDVLYTELPDAVSRSVEALANKGEFYDVQLPEKICGESSIAK